GRGDADRLRVQGAVETQAAARGQVRGGLAAERAGKGAKGEAAAGMSWGTGAHRRSGRATYCRSFTPSQICEGRNMRLLFICSNRCASQPATRATAYMGVKRSVGSPSISYTMPL